MLNASQELQILVKPAIWSMVLMVLEDVTLVLLLTVNTVIKTPVSVLLVLKAFLMTDQEFAMLVMSKTAKSVFQATLRLV